ncbi:NAD-dependent epimerase/dehydratase family protein [Mucilaginibacter sp. UYCu711]|uniref:NAD-dependent epimerase/dehydratase family protein n=1 Tax=Mucilaginibacter sp. UYCu711 TaxID=3156339 RepID=UPI003D19745B
MKVLVTGSGGQLGSITVKQLRSCGHEVVGLDIILSETTDQFADIRDKNRMMEVIKGFDAIIHTAAVHGKHYDLNYSRESFIDINIYGTLNLLNAAVHHGVGKFLYVSTTSIYGSSMIDPDQAVWVDEQLADCPRDIYDITKQTAEQLCKDFFNKEKLQCSVYRVGRFLPETVNLTFNHRLYRGLDERDGAKALELALNQTFDQFEIFNISSGSPFLKEELVILRKSPKMVILKHFPEAEEFYKMFFWKFPECIDRVYCSEKAKHLLGYFPKYTFKYLLNEILHGQVPSKS